MKTITIFKDRVNGEKDNRHLQKAIDKLEEIRESYFIIPDISVIEKDMDKVKKHVDKIVNLDNLLHAKAWVNDKVLPGVYAFCELALCCSSGEYLVCDFLDKAKNKTHLNLIVAAIEAKATDSIKEGLMAKLHDRCLELKIRKSKLEV